MQPTTTTVAPRRRLVPAAIRRRRLLIIEAHHKLVWGHTALRMRRLETAELSRLRRQFERIPEARVATIVPTYRRPHLLLKAVQSALAQSMSDQVIIVVDDAGGLPELPADPRLFAVSLSSNTGVAGVVRNIGIGLSRSEFVAFLDDDNEWESNHLETALAVLETARIEHRPGLVYTAVRRVYPDGSLMDVLSTPFDRKLLSWMGYVDVSALVTRRIPRLHFSRLVRPFGSSPKEDWELAIRLSRKLRSEHIPVPTVRYLINPDSYWSDWSADALENH